MSGQATPGRPAERVELDGAALDALVARLAQSEDALHDLSTEVTRLSGEIDTAVGHGPAADAFRSGIAELERALAEALRSATAEFGAHRSAVTRGSAEVTSADDWSGGRMRKL